LPKSQTNYIEKHTAYKATESKSEIPVLCRW